MNRFLYQRLEMVVFVLVGQRGESCLLLKLKMSDTDSYSFVGVRVMAISLYYINILSNM